MIHGLTHTFSLTWIGRNVWSSLAMKTVEAWSSHRVLFGICTGSIVFVTEVPEETSLHLLLGAQNWVWSKVSFFVGLQEPLLATVKRWKLTWFEHFMCHCSLSKTNLQGTLEAGWHHSWQRKCLMDIFKGWTSLPMPEQWHLTEKTGTLLNHPSCPPSPPYSNNDLFG